MESINIITLGCSKNTIDSEVIANSLQKEGYTVLHESAEDTDIVIVNTCSFIQDAKEESIEEILMHAERKKAGHIKKLYVIGCLAQRYHDDLVKMLPEADGIYAYKDLGQFLKQSDFNLLTSPRGTLSTPKHYAYLKISEGCDRHCAFCAIPNIRGKHISKPIDMVVREAEQLASQGVKELMVIAQDSTYYGMDLNNTRQLEVLLRKLAGVKGIEWIRLHYAYPMGFPYEVLDVIRDYNQFCKYIDIPLQHISANVLKSMNRGCTESQMYSLVERIRTKVPGIAIRTTLLSGFPTETREDHKALVQFVKDMRFDRLGVFSYSQEEDTPAYPLGDPIKKAEKNRRLEELMTLQEEISLELNEAKVGSVQKVIIDEETDEFYLGRTEFDSPEVDNEVLIDKETPLTIGEFYPIRITEADYFDLYGKKI